MVPAQADDPTTTPTPMTTPSAMRTPPGIGVVVVVRRILTTGATRSSRVGAVIARIVATAAARTGAE